MLRFVQGFGVGGEWGGAVLMVVEHGHQGRRGFYASWVQAGVPAGLLLATAVFNLFSLLPEEVVSELGLAGAVPAGDRACWASGCSFACRFSRARCSRKCATKTGKPNVPFFEVLAAVSAKRAAGDGGSRGRERRFYIFTVFVLTYAHRPVCTCRQDCPS